MHIHVSALDAMITWLYVIIGMFLMRLVSMKFPDSNVGKALMVIH